MKERLEVGQIVNTFGIKGFVKVYPYVDDINRFDDLKNVYLKSKNKENKFEIEEVKYQKGMVLLKFKGIDTIEQAQNLRNFYIEIDRKDAVKLEEGQYFIADLLGLDVFLDTGEKLGNLDDIYGYGSSDIFVVKNIDLEKGKITVHLIDGLI